MNTKFVVIAATVLLSLVPTLANAHCDTMNGPVVSAAKKALETGNVNLVLIWVQQKDEAEIIAAFQKTIAVRKLSPAAKDLADMYFFETLVRIHRAGEGVPYTGLKPAEVEVDPGIAAADGAIDAGSVDGLLTSLTHSVDEGIRHRFAELIAKKKFASDDIVAGREYVKAYVEFIHFVERLHQSVTSPVEGHFPEAQQEHHH